MKKLILTALVTSLGISLFAQGTVNFNNDVGGLRAPVYGPAPGNPFLSQIGNGPTDLPPGTTQWGGFTRLAGPSFFAQLLGATGYNAPESGLLPGSPGTSFKTGSGSGFVVPTTETFMNILPDAPQATLEMVAWDNTSGLYPTWSQASVAWRFGLIAAGTSGTWNQDKIGGNVNPPPNLINSTDPTQHLRSFNIYFVPEPTTAALAGLGATALLTVRGRK
jgi:hypothetical protein